MTTQTQATSVTTSTEVQAPIEHAFRVFTEIEVTFTADGPDRTQVVLTHRHLDRHGDGWQSMRDAVGSGWDLTRYAEVAAQPA
jgi:hypothetical protein